MDNGMMTGEIITGKNHELQIAFSIPNKIGAKALKNINHSMIAGIQNSKWNIDYEDNKTSNTAEAQCKIGSILLDGHEIMASTQKDLTDIDQFPHTQNCTLSCLVFGNIRTKDKWIKLIIALLTYDGSSSHILI